MSTPSLQLPSSGSSSSMSEDDIGRTLAETFLREVTTERPILFNSSNRAFVSAGTTPERPSFVGYGVGDREIDEKAALSPELIDFKNNFKDYYIKAKLALDLASSASFTSSTSTASSLPISSSVSSTTSTSSGGERIELFCVGHTGFDSATATNIEHAMPWETMRNNVGKFVEFLKKPENKVVAKAFLEVPKIDKYIARDTDGVIKPRKYLYTSCFNQEANLWLTCSHCNLKKKTKSWDAFCKENPTFGGEYLKRVKEKDRVRKGIIFDFVPQSKPDPNKDVIQHNGHTFFVGSGTGL